MRMIFPLICKCGNENCKLFDEISNPNRRCSAWPKNIIICANDAGVILKMTMTYAQWARNDLEIMYDSIDWANPTIHEEISKLILSKIMR